MSTRLRALGLVSVALVVPAVASAQVAIEHQDVACIVAGQFPVLDACFRPGPDLARARVYFRPEGAPNWYYVEASTPTPPKANDPAELLCRRATLPKPKKSLLEKHVEYYLEATGKRLESSQTETFRPLVVKNEGECKKKVVAPFVPNAAVQVFPAMPAAFAAGGGLSGAAVAAVVGAGVAGGTGVVVAATNGGGPAPTTLAPVTTTQPPITVPATTTTTTLPPEVAFDPVFKVFNNGVLQTGTKIAGTEPLKLRFYMCESTGPLRLKFGVTVNGGLATAGCDTTITFTTGGFTTGLGAVVASRNGVESRGTSYSVVMQIVSDGPGNNPKANQPLTVDASPLISFREPVLSQASAPQPAVWVSQLDIPGGRGQVVLNGSDATFPATGGRVPLAGRPRSGENRVEATLVQATGQPGLWRFELGADQSVTPGSLRVIAGQVGLVTPDALVFRMKGRPGERVVFTFRLR